MRYRVPYKLTQSPYAATKARIVHAGFPGVQWVEFLAPTHKQAREALQELIANGDERPVMGRSGIRDYVVTDGEESSAE